MKPYSIVRRLIVVMLAVELLAAVLVSALALAHERHERFQTFDVMLRGRADSLLGSVQQAGDEADTVMLDGTAGALATLHKLRDLGVGIGMDDFGTGYSSLSYLRRFPFSKVKIDRSFIADLGTGAECDAIVTAVIELCQTLGMTTVAEGVETEAQLQYLRIAHCSEAQGYLFSTPQPASAVAALCRQLNRRALVDGVA